MSPKALKPSGKKMVQVDKLAEILRLKREEGKKIGLITGGFDIIHRGHISLFRFAKESVDILVIGVEQDKTITISKGKNRPINTLANRCDFLSELNSVDYIFAVPFVFRYGEIDNADRLFAGVYKKLRPDYLITNIDADRFCELKRKRAQEIGIGFLGQKTPKDTSSSSIVNRIEEEI